jgi:hypothetical protein
LQESVVLEVKKATKEETEKSRNTTFNTKGITFQEMTKPKKGKHGKLSDMFVPDEHLKPAGKGAAPAPAGGAGLGLEAKGDAKAAPAAAAAAPKAEAKPDSKDAAAPAKAKAAAPVRMRPPPPDMFSKADMVGVKFPLFVSEIPAVLESLKGRREYYTTAPPPEKKVRSAVPGLCFCRACAPAPVPLLSCHPLTSACVLAEEGRAQG